MIFPRTFKYLNYILLPHHRRGHGIHSPFIFDLVTRVFTNKIDPGIIIAAERIRRKMLSDNSGIVVKDLGSGSVSLKSNLRKVSDIARRSPVPAKYGVLLSKMAAEFGSPHIIELGTSLGISTIYMASSCPDSTVDTIEGCPSTAGIARQNFIEMGLNNIHVSEGPFDEVLPGIISTGIKPGLIFIDGNHRKEPVLKYFNILAEFADSKTVIIIDDISYSEEMAEAWNEIKLHKKVTASIDIYRMGLLFLKEGITHNHYIIRY